MEHPLTWNMESVNMTYVRKDLWDLGDGWNDTMLWYAKAVQELQKRPITDNTSWQFLGAIHGFKKDLWISHWQIDEETPLPTQKDQDLFWNQCQHQSWYFLPWHRGYLLAFENIVRETIIKLNGPSDWALPYWNYNEIGTRLHSVTLPHIFYEAKLPDGTDNPLALPKLRFGNTIDGRVVINPLKINLKSLDIALFTGGATGGTPGFGGPETVFHFDGDVQGGLENNPHNPVHIAVGGHINRPGEKDPFEGLMSDPQMAGLDPVFWLHHANIDRLWQVWLDRNPAHKNPVDDPAWVEGPPSGGRPFIMPAPDGSTYTYIVSQMLSLQDLGYTYQDLPTPPQANLASAKVEATAVADTKVTELLGANAQPIKLLGSRFESPVRLDKPGIAKVAQKLAARGLLTAGNAAPLPEERVYLNVENIRGQLNAVILSLYVNLPDGASPEAHPELYAGDIGLFGVRVASQKDESHAGAGLTAVLDITDIVNRLNVQGDLDLDHLHISLFASTDLTPAADISIGRISVYRQGQ